MSAERQCPICGAGPTEDVSCSPGEGEVHLRRRMQCSPTLLGAHLGEQSAVRRGRQLGQFVTSAKRRKQIEDFPGH